jgi:diguanylate cyclase (GGDEF)-like protein
MRPADPDELALLRFGRRRYPGIIVRVQGGLEAPVGPADGSAESPRFVWTMGAVLFGAGASVGALSLLLPHPESFDETALWTIIAIAALGAIVALLIASRAPVWPVHILVAAAIAMVTVAAHYSHEAGGFYTLFYVWIGLWVIFFFARRAALLYIVGIAGAYAALLIVDQTAGGPARWITTVGAVALSALVIDWLVRRVRRFARESAEVASERAELLSALAKVARTDDLTGLPNRRAWDEGLELELARAERDDTPLCIGLMDLDRFKLYNDDNGHQAGDRLLKEIAAAWRSELRTTDILARYGGEEFALALPGCDLEDASLLVERLRVATPEHQTCSAGLVLWDGKETSERIFGRADRALYAAKEAGRDRIVTG